MKLWHSIFLIFFLPALSVYAQKNHVPNGSFEEHSSCPVQISETLPTAFKYFAVNEHCSGWHQYTVGGKEGGTVDYFNSCYPDTNTSAKGVDVPKNARGFQPAASGNAYIGCYTAGSSSIGNNYKEYVSRQIMPLKAWHTYEVSMSVSLADSAAFATDDLGMYFFIKDSFTRHTDQVLQVTPQVSYSSYGAITNKTNWTRLTTVWLADSAYNNIVIGGFKDVNSMIQVPTPPGSNNSYYYIDSIVIKKFEGVKVHINDTIFCPGNKVSIPYTVETANYFQPGNVFTAQLSDYTGDFTYPKDLGKITSTTSGVIDCTIPASNIPTGNYNIRVISSNPVATFYPEVTIGIQKLNPIASSTGTVCEGKPLQLKVTDSIPGVKYNWTGPGNYTSSKEDTIIKEAMTDMTGIFTVIANLDNCSATDTTAVIVKPKPEKPILASNSPVIEGADIELEVTNYKGAYSYLWINPILAITSGTNLFTVINAKKSHSGTYVVFAILDGCEDSASIEVLVLDESETGHYFIYPNPNNGNFTLQGYSKQDQFIKYRILNAAGQLIMNGTTQAVNRRIKENISMPFVASGDYFLQLRADGKEQSIPFTVLHQ